MSRHSNGGPPSAFTQLNIIREKRFPTCEVAGFDVDVVQLYNLTLYIYRYIHHCIYIYTYIL